MSPRELAILQSFAFIAFAVLAAGSFLFRVSIALGPLDRIDGYAIPDDAYLFLDLARNIAHGLGPLYGEAYTNGFQPLFAFVLAPIFWFVDGGDTPLRASLVILSVCDTLTLVVLGRFVRSVCDRSWWPALLVAAAWTFHHAVLRNTLSGMETSLSLLGLSCVLVAHRGLCQETQVQLGARRAFAIGATVGLAMLIRVDSILLLAALGSCIGWRMWRGALVVRNPLRTVAWWALGAALCFLPWIVYSAYYTGDLYPVSGRAVQFQAEAHYRMFPLVANDVDVLHLRRAAGEIVRSNLVVGLTIAALLPFVLYLRRARVELRARAGLLAPLFVHVALLYLAYSLHIRGTWFFHRYLHPTTLPAMLTLAFCAHALLQSQRSDLARAVLVGVLSVGLLFGSRLPSGHGGYAWLLDDKPHGNFGYRAIGVWCRDNIPAGTVIGAKQSGAIGYYADRCKVINLDGVVNRDAFEALLERRMFAWMGTRGIDVYVLWDYGAQFLRHFSTPDPGTPPERDLVPFETIPDIHSWSDPGENPFRLFRLE